MEEMIGTMRGRLVSERGSVGVIVALVLFVVMGMLTMTWNTAELSKAKMRLQNAADSAALAHAVWQARGMNAVQNINDEMYEALSLASKLRTIAEVFEGIATGFEIAANLPVVGPVFRGLAIAMHTIGVITGGPAGWMAARVCGMFLKYIQMAYVYGSSAFGLWNAQQLAAQNEADPLAKLDGTTTTADSGGWHFGIYAIGLSWPIRDAFLLPLEPSEKDEVNTAPWKGPEKNLFTSAFPPWNTIYRIAGTGEKWDIKPYVSKRGKQKEGLKINKDGKVTDDSVLPGPTVWIAFKLGKHIQTLPLSGFFNPGDEGRWTHSLPMFAIAAAQCITGDVIPHSKKREAGKPNYRPSGFGTGATAKLVPVSEVFYGMDKAGNAVGHFVDAIIYH